MSAAPIPTPVPTSRSELLIISTILVLESLTLIIKSAGHWTPITPWIISLIVRVVIVSTKVIITTIVSALIITTIAATIISVVREIIVAEIVVASIIVLLLKSVAIRILVSIRILVAIIWNERVLFNYFILAFIRRNDSAIETKMWMINVILSLFWKNPTYTNPI